MATRKATLDPKMTCRGKWSACGGTEPSISAKWHLGAACTKKRADQMKVAAAEIKPPKSAKQAPAKIVAIADRKPPTPKREPVARVASIVAPIPTVTKAELDAERKGDRNN